MARAKTEKEAKDGKAGEKTVDKATLLSNALADIGKRFGEESIMRLGADYAVKCDVVSTGSLGVDAAIGIGGVPRGRIVEFFGPESSGKTTIALQCVANAQKNGGTAAFIDAEHALDPAYSRKLGVNLDNLLVSQPDSGEQALEICELLAKSGAVDVIVIDSVAALTPQVELDGEMGQSHVGLQARLMSQGLRKLTGIVKKTNTCVIFINQIRMKIGGYGNPETTTGGNALKFYASLRLDIRRGQQVKRGEETIGNDTRVKVVKNKMAPPFRSAEFEILFNQGVNYLGELIDLAVATGVVKKTGNWMSHGETRMGNGKDKVSEFLQANPDIFAAIDQATRQALLETSVPAKTPAETPASDAPAEAEVAEVA